MVGQSVRGKVVDAEDNRPVPFAGVTVNGDQLGVTADDQGVFTLPFSSANRTLTIRGFGYEKTQVVLSGGEMRIEVKLSAENTVLTEVEVLAGENPLHRIIRNVIDNRNDNRPTSLDAFTYDTYSKMLFTLMESDSMPPLFDTIYLPVDSAVSNSEVNKDSIVKIDSSGYRLREFMDEQHLFLMESVTRRTFAKPRDHEEVLASRISGLSMPLFVLLANEIQSFDFYDNYITIMGSDRVSPVAPGAIGRYVYLAQDTLIDGLDTTFVIEYFPVANHQFKGLDGELHIRSGSWALTRVIARPTGQDVLGIMTGENEAFGVEIQQVFSRIENVWFPALLTIDFRRFSTETPLSSDGPISIQNDAGGELVGLGKTWLRNIQINPDVRTSSVPRIAVKVNEDAGEMPESFWDQYREDTLTAKERRTYEVIDSVGAELNVEQNLMWLMALATGKIRYGYFDYDLNKIMRYNVYEGFRLGLGVETNSRVSDWFSVGGQVGYGFGDKMFKYGYYAKLHVDKTSEWDIYGGYSLDIEESAGTQFALNRTSILGNADYRFLSIPRFDEVSDVYFGTRFRLWPNLRVDLTARRQNRYTTGDYRFRVSDEQGDWLVNGFNLALARLELEYAPNDRFISGYFGLRPLETTYPRFRLKYEESLDGFFDRNYPYRRIDGQAIHQIRRVYTGTTTIQFGGSVIMGDVPYGLLAGPDANGNGNLQNLSSAGSAATLVGFETMPFNVFAANQYVYLDVRHSLEDRWISSEEWNPTLEFVYRFGLGWLDHPEHHVGVNLQGFSAGYHEAGIEFNKLYSGLGVGFYQRFGPYYSGSYGENATLKLTYRADLF